MRTYLTNWSIVKSAANPNQLLVISDWSFTGKMITLVRTENIYDSSGVITDSIVNFEIGSGTPNPTSINTKIGLPIPWYQLSLSHKTHVKATEASILTDDESNDTIRASVI